MKAFFRLLLVLLASLEVSAQADMTMPSLRRLQQSTYFNPAFIPSYDLSIGLPVLSGTFLNLNVSGLDLNTILSSVDPGSGLLSGTSLAANLDQTSIGIRASIATEIFHVRFKVKDYAIGIHAAVKTQVNGLVSRDLIRFMLNGNLPFKGQTAHLGGMDISALAYQEIGLSVAREIGRWSFGVRIKYLNGTACVLTDNIVVDYATAALSGDPALITVGGAIHTNMLPSLFDTVNGRPSNDKQFSGSDVTFGKNNGMALDLGATYQATPRLLVHASMTDLGAIRWSSRPYTYSLANQQLSFQGAGSLNQATDSAARSQFVDSLIRLIKPVASQGAFTTWIPLRIMLGADYDIGLRDRLGFLLQMQYYGGTLTPATSFSYTRRAGTNWDITASYGIFNGSFANVGLGTAVKWGAFQLFFVQDDILFYFFPEHGRNLYLRFGCNLVWGRALNPNPRSKGF